jgi:arginyl-tRNA synthetase
MIKETIHSHITACLEGLGFSADKEFTVEIPNNTDHGDYSTNCA